ncbi:MAG TPA: lytic transglycosylase domain-containing protein, partial [Candidatus Limnocylindrales bacterium]|nr:lytic transglycosylase domain-containing protein [Candidatus Limnocylindrales bacterium]
HLPSGYLDIPTADIASFDRDENPPLEAVPEQTTAAPAQNPTKPMQNAVAPEPAAASPASPPNPAMTQADIEQVVREIASKHQLDPDFVASVIKAESDFKTRAVSRKGAQGLMQLMPQTAAQLGLKDAFDPKANVEAGTAHLSALLDLYHDDAIKALAAYNAGAHRVDQYNGVPPYKETQAYVAKIVRDFNAKKRAQMKAAAAAKLAAQKSQPSKTAAPQVTPASATKRKSPAPKQRAAVSPSQNPA